MDNQQPLQLGHSADFGSRAIEKRIGALRSIGDLSGDNLLDVGCGIGSYTIRIAESFGHAVGIDLEPQRLEVFRQRVTELGLMARIEVQQESATSLPFADGSFDVVTAIETLEHIDDLDRGLAEIRRVLQKDGRLFITCPNRLFPIETHALRMHGKSMSGRKMPFLPWVPPIHTRLAQARTFTPRSLRRRLQMAGFTPRGLTWIMPPFDHSELGRRVRRPVDFLERMPGVRRFGVSIVMVAD
jgi:ubiquinone/menaquinone biosynthesis C-methylase UbiE